MNRNDAHKTDFCVIGVVKGGTTSLYEYLRQHPQIYLPPIKEINHFSQADIVESDFLPEYATDVRIDLPRYFQKGMPEMVHIAHVNDAADYARLYTPAGPHQLRGDISNSYLICPSTAQAIHTHNPEAKLIAVLRNPIKRAWSQYLMNLREAKTSTQDFVTEIRSDAEAKVQGWGANHQYLALGNYAAQLEEYYAHFDSPQVLVLFFEDYVRSPQANLRQICEFLGVDASYDFDTSMQKNKASLPRNAGLNRLLVSTGIIKAAKGIVPRSLRSKASGLLYSDKKLPSMSPAETEWLREYYSESVASLGELLGRDLSDVWPEFNPAQ